MFGFLLPRLSLFYAEAGTMLSVRLPPKRGGRLALHALARLSDCLHYCILDFMFEFSSVLYGLLQMFIFLIDLSAVSGRE
jgi:hypothetical protein